MPLTGKLKASIQALKYEKNNNNNNSHATYQGKLPLFDLFFINLQIKIDWALKLPSLCPPKEEVLAPVDFFLQLEKAIK